MPSGKPPSNGPYIPKGLDMKYDWKKYFWFDYGGIILGFVCVLFIMGLFLTLGTLAVKNEEIETQKYCEFYSKHLDELTIHEQYNYERKCK